MSFNIDLKQFSAGQFLPGQYNGITGMFNSSVGIRFNTSRHEMPFPANDSSHFIDSRVTAHKGREYAVSSINIGLYDLWRSSLLYFIDPF